MRRDWPNQSYARIARQTTNKVFSIFLEFEPNVIGREFV